MGAPLVGVLFTLFVLLTKGMTREVIKLMMRILEDMKKCSEKVSITVDGEKNQRKTVWNKTKTFTCVSLIFLTLCMKKNEEKILNFGHLFQFLSVIFFIYFFFLSTFGAPIWLEKMVNYCNAMYLDQSKVSSPWTASATLPLVLPCPRKPNNLNLGLFF